MQRFTQVDMLNLAKKIMEWPLQVCIEVDGVKYLLAHACTSMPDWTSDQGHDMDEWGGIANTKEELKRLYEKTKPIFRYQKLAFQQETGKSA